MNQTVTDAQMTGLYEAALKAAGYSYSPYSLFSVGAALLFSDGSVETGANIENRSYGLANCAERTAMFAAAAKGRRELKAVAIATPKADYAVGPCGACRQVLTEFGPSGTPVWFGPSLDKVEKTTLGALYPFDSLHELAKDAE